jgi:hypothetical protein
MDGPAEWPDGQRVVVIALPADCETERVAPPAELLEEDAKELATKPELSRAWLGDELA